MKFKKQSFAKYWIVETSFKNKLTSSVKSKRRGCFSNVNFHLLYFLIYYLVENLFKDINFRAFGVIIWKLNRGRVFINLISMSEKYFKRRHGRPIFIRGEPITAWKVFKYGEKTPYLDTFHKGRGHNIILLWTIISVFLGYSRK